MAEPSSRNQTEPDIYPAQVSLLYSNAFLAYSVTLVNAGILAAVQAPAVPLRAILAWLSCLLAISAVRGLALWLYRRDPLHDQHARLWGRMYLGGAALAGSAWGSSAIALFPADSLPHQVFVAFVLAGMSAGGVGVLAARMEAALVFLVPALTPLAFRFFAVGGDVHTLMGIMTLLFLAGMTGTAWTLYRATDASLRLRFNNTALASQIEQRRQAEERLYREKHRLETTLTSLGEGVVIADADGRIEYLNPVAEELCGQRMVEAINRDIRDVLRVYDDENQATGTALEATLSLGRQVREQRRMQGEDGNSFPVEQVATPLRNRHGGIIGVVAILRDITDVQVMTERLAYAASHDALTGLPNRNLLYERMERSIARARRRQGHLGVLFIDLDHFKQINDRMGHEAGDVLLYEVAQRLKAAVRDEDTVARFGGDELVVLLDAVSDRTGLRKVVRKILGKLAQTYSVRRQGVSIQASIGAALFPDDGEDSHTLLRHADAAMYRTKLRHRRRASG